MSGRDVRMRSKIRPMSEAIVERTFVILTEMFKGDKEDDEVFRSHGVDSRNFYRDLGDLKENVEFWSKKIKVIKDQGLFEGELKRKLKEKQLKTKLDRAAEGYYYGPPHFGYRIVDGEPVPTEDLQTVSQAMRRSLRGEPQYKIAEDLHLSRGQLRIMLRNRFYRGEFLVSGKLFHGNWELPATPEEFDEVQKRLGVVSGRLLPGYEWKDGKRVLKEGWKETYEKVYSLRIHGEYPFSQASKGLKLPYSVYQIAKKLKLPYDMARRMLTSKKVTGQHEVDGKLVDSGYEQAVDSDTWKRAQAVKVPGYRKKQQEAAIVQNTILASMSCYRWQLREKVQVKASSVNKVIRRLKSSQPPLIKERDEDGLLQTAWLPFPQDPLVATREKRESLKRRRILDALPKEAGLRLSEIAKKTDIHFNTVTQNIHKLLHEGLVKEEDGKIRISELGITVLKKAVSLEEAAESARKHGQETRKKILESLTTPLTFTEVKNKTEFTAATVSNWLRRLIDEREVEKRMEPGKRYPVYVKLSPQQKVE
jgi:DNA-binding MarR family transcriptional regulator